jgi:prepilin-type N-terminal cleavage/methylation domain-containing protein
MSTPEHARTARVRGFTLIEVLIAIVIMSVLGGGLIAIMRQMGSFYRHNEDAVYAMQTIRAATELMASELRMASPADLLYATPDSVAVRFDIVFGVVCDSTAADEATLYVYDRVLNAAVSGGFVGIAFSGPYDSAYVYADAWNPSPSATGSGPMAICSGLGAPTTFPSGDYMTIAGWGAQFGDVPDRGSLVKGYARLRYRFAPSALGAGTALFRDAQELVSPLNSGAAFSYLMAGGGVQSTVASADLDDVRAIRFIAQAVGDGPNEFNVQRDITFDIPLRN